MDSSQNNISLKNRLICSLFHLCTMNNKRSPSALYFLYFLFVDIVDKRQMSALQFGYFCPQKSDIMTFFEQNSKEYLKYYSNNSLKDTDYRSRSGGEERHKCNK